MRRVHQAAPLRQLPGTAFAARRVATATFPQPTAWHLMSGVEHEPCISPIHISLSASTVERKLETSSLLSSLVWISSTFASIIGLPEGKK